MEAMNIVYLVLLKLVATWMKRREEGNVTGRIKNDRLRQYQYKEGDAKSLERKRRMG